MIEKLREELINDIISYLDKSVPAHLSDENNKEYADLGLELGNTITQIIVFLTTYCHSCYFIYHLFYNYFTL